MAKINYQLNQGDQSVSLVYEDKAEWTPEGLCQVIRCVKETLGCQCTNHKIGVVMDSTEASGELPPFPKEYEPKHMDDHFGIRPRLPNNVVDVSKLSIQEATTDEALIRCPICGQAHSVIVSDNVNFYLMRKHYPSNEFGIVKSVSGSDEGSLLSLSRQCDAEHENDPANKLDYFFLVQGMPLTEDRDFAVVNDTELFCPVCHKSAPFIQWKEAWQEPSKYFEHTHICEACGGECVEQIDTDKKGLLVCDACGRKWLNNKPAQN